MAAEKNDKKGNGLQIFLVVLVLVSMGLNVYLFRYYAEQDDGIEVMTSWSDANQQIREELRVITTTLTDLEARQSTQEASTQSVLETLTLMETRRAEEAAAPVVEPNWLDKESWLDANAEIHEVLESITTTLRDLEARQLTQETSAQSLLETLTMIENRQAEEAAAPVVEPNWVDKESWATSSQQMREELSTIKALLGEIVAELEEARAVKEAETARGAVEHNESAFNLEGNSASTVPVLAQVADRSLEHEVVSAEEMEEHVCPVVEVKLLPGDSVWSIVQRFKPFPRPALLQAVVEYNGITNPRQLPVRFPVKVPMDLVNGQ